MNTNYTTYLSAKNYSANTIKNYLKYVKEALDFINKPDNNITYMDILSWSTTFNNMSINSQNIRISAIRNYFEFLQEIGEINANPTENFKRKKVREGDYKEKPYIAPHYLRDMVNAANSFRNKAIILLYATTGLRVSELTGVTLDNYYNMKGENNRELKIVGKGNKSRYVYVNDETKEAIDMYLNTNPVRKSDYLFVSGEGNHIAPNNLNQTIKSIAKKAGIPFWKDMSNHCLRAACATSKNEQGVSLPTIQKMLGHSKIETTMIYIKQSRQAINEAFRNTAF